MKKTILIIFTLLIFNCKNLKSQGCSDAGFCSMGTLNQKANKDSVKINSVNVIFSYGIGEQSTTIIQTIPELNLSLFPNNSIQLRLPYFFISGNLGNNNGIGDFSFSITQSLLTSEIIKLNVTLGTKIATGFSNDFLPTDNISIENLSLPMPYQTSLATNDMILGASLDYRQWKFSTGYQHVLTNKNKNGFLRSKWNNNYDAQKYFESNLLDRGNDALLRIERIFPVKKISVTAGLLGIIRLQNDKITSLQNESIDVEGSNGLTLNLTGSAQYSFSNHAGLNISFGTPIKVRKVRPDGLTRSLVINAAFKYNF